MAASFSSYLLLFLFTLTINHVLASLLLEDGYTVTTLVDGNKLHVNPFSILPLFESSDLLVLDSARSTFYTLSFASSQVGAIEMKNLAGNGVAGYADGELGSAMFDKPRSFAVDYRGNVYVADRLKHTIRKISESGVSTIAGGFSQTTGNKDGPAQNASFSNDFELAFVPERCSIMISDRGNRLVREMKLKTEDCTRGSQSGVGMSYFWAIGLGISCLLGMILGFVGRPYVISRTGRIQASDLQQDMEPLLNQPGEASGDAFLRHQKRNC